MWAFVEKIKKGKQNDSARHRAGFPIAYEWKDVPVGQVAVQDERVMADGRPAYAWWNEIQMLRKEIADSNASLESNWVKIQDAMAVARIAKWAITRDVLSHDILVRIKFTLDLTPEALSADPGKFCSLIPPESGV